MNFEVVAHQNRDQILFIGNLNSCYDVLNDYLEYLLDKGAKITYVGDSDVEIAQYIVNRGYIFIRPVSLEEELKKLTSRAWAMSMVKNLPLDWSTWDASLGTPSGTIT
jgi:hypothetical protein